jgi:hypothetical protein
MSVFAFAFASGSNPERVIDTAPQVSWKGDEAKLSGQMNGKTCERLAVKVAACIRRPSRASGSIRAYLQVFSRDFFEI